MKAFCIEIITQTASFRNPEFQNFHKTLELPPPTTIIGMAGAALGLSPKAAQAFFDKTPFQIGIYGQHQGRTIDTWKYIKHKAANKKVHSIVKREILFNNTFFIAFAAKHETKLNQLRKAFEQPTYALTMGNSDSLAFIKKIENNLPIKKHNKLKNCIAKGDIIGEVIQNASNELTFSIYQSSEPITYDLPTRFNYNSDYGERTVTSIATFSFVNKEMTLNFQIEGVTLKDIFIPLFKL